jgi:hypothetical protein
LENNTKTFEILKVAFGEKANGRTQLIGFSELKQGGFVEDATFRDVNRQKT